MGFVYFGSGIFSRGVLNRLCLQGARPALVVSQPDSARARKYKIQPTPVSLFAVEKKIPVIKPASLKDNNLYRELKQLGSDFFVVADYGKILPSEIISIPNIFAIGVHPSLLPKYRGAAPINWALINGDKETGGTIFKINPGIDAGDIFLSRKIAIEGNDDVVSLTEKLSEACALALRDVLCNIGKEEYQLFKQDNKSVSFARKLVKEDGRIKWELDADKLNNLIRGILGWPCAYAYYKGKSFQVLQADVCSEECKANPGVIVKVDKLGIYISCGRGVLRVKKVKPQNKREMTAWAFVCGYRLKVGDKFE